MDKWIGGRAISVVGWDNWLLMGLFPEVAIAMTPMKC